MEESKVITTKWLLPLLVLMVAIMSCDNSSTNPQPPEPPPTDSTMSISVVNEMIEEASPGDTVKVEVGTYIMYEKLSLEPGITLVAKDENNKPIFDARTDNLPRVLTPGLMVMEYNSETSGVTFKNIKFYNIGFKIRNFTDLTFKHCVFDYGERPPGPYDNSVERKGPAYIDLIRTDTVLIDHCEFLRRKGNSGRGISNYYSSNVTITNNRFGGEDPKVTGYFVTAINERGTNSLIAHNTIRKKKTGLSMWITGSMP